MSILIFRIPGLAPDSRVGSDSRAGSDSRVGQNLGEGGAWADPPPIPSDFGVGGEGTGGEGLKIRGSSCLPRLGPFSGSADLHLLRLFCLSVQTIWVMKLCGVKRLTQAVGGFGCTIM